MADVGRRLSESSTSLKLALIGLMVTMVIHTVGFSTNYWNRMAIGREEFKQGLWQRCFCSTTCICAEIPMGTTTNLDISRAGESIGLAGIVFTLLLSFIGLLRVKEEVWKTVSSITCFISCFSIIVGIFFYPNAVIISTFAAKSRIHFSFFLCVVSGVSLLVCTCLLIQDKRTVRRRAVERTAMHYDANQVEDRNQGLGYIGPQYQPGIQSPPTRFIPVIHSTQLDRHSLNRDRYIQPLHADPPPRYGTKWFRV